MTCAVCGTVAIPGARFCHNCGSRLQSTAAASVAERRVVTILFGDLSDFTAWAEDLDPERVGAVTDRVMAALAGAVKTFGGHVDKLTGDGIMAVFGAPVAHEDDAERAVRAALSMQRAVRRVLDDERGGGAPSGLRVGLNTGEVVAGVQAGLEYTVIGDAVNTAARLADAAAIGGVYAGERTATTTRRVASWRALRPLRLKGKRAPVESFELLGLLDAPGTRSGMGDEAPFIGRETELAWVASRLAEVDDSGTPRVLLLTAEAGLGKTRFAAQVERMAAGYAVTSGRYSSAGGVRTLSVRCAAFGERRRLGPLTDLVRDAIGVPTDAATAMTRNVVEERLGRLAGRIGWTPSGARIELLATALSVASADYPLPSQRPWTTTEPDGFDVEAVPSAVAEVLTGLAQEGPVMVVVDDLQDATAETIDALGAMLAKIDGAILVLLLGRPELVRTAGALTRLADAEVSNLPALRGADAARLLSAYLGGGRLPPADTDRLLATAQGNPYYLAELVTLLMERGGLTQVPADGSPVWRLAADSLGGALLSRDLAAVLAARIDALPIDARAALRDATVVGDTVPSGALEALHERRTGRAARSGVAAVELERAVEELLSRRMLRRIRGGYAFVTPLLREAAYAGLGKADLANRHAYLARWAAGELTPVTGWVRSVGSDADADAFIAQHVEHAVTLADQVNLRPDAAARQVATLAIAALGRSARRAINMGEPAQAVRHAERAVALAGDVLPRADRLVYARALLQLGRPNDALVQAEKLIADSAEARDEFHTGAALLLIGRVYRLLGDVVRARKAWHEALTVSNASGHANVQAEALRRLGMSDFLLGRLAEAGSRLAQAYQVAVGDDDLRSQAWSLQNLAWVATTRGDFAGADATLGRAARLFAEQHDPVGRAWLRGTTAFARLLAGRLAEARRLARVFLPFGERVGDQWAVATLRAVDAFAAAESGDLAEADRSARRAYGEFAAARDDWGRGFALVVRGVVARGLAEPTHAVDLLSEALEYAESTRHPLLIGMSRTIRGFTYLERGDAAAAEADARAVLEIVEPHNVMEAAQVGPRVLLGAARLALGDTAAALRHLEPVAKAAHAPSMLLSRRYAIATYSSALLADGRIDDAVDAAAEAIDATGEDVRSRTVARLALARALEARGDREGAQAAATEAAQSAYATQQRGERADSDALLTSLSVQPHS